MELISRWNSVCLKKEPLIEDLDALDVFAGQRGIQRAFCQTLKKH